MDRSDTLSTPGRTVFADWRPGPARLALTGFALFAAVAVAVTWSPWKSGFADRPRGRGTDIELYRAEIDRIRGGESYYQAAAAELPARGFPTRSVFNWRLPIPIWPLGLLSDPNHGKLLLGGVAIVATLLAFVPLAAAWGLRGGALGAVLLFGALMFAMLGDIFVMPVMWAAVAVTLSLALYGLDRPQAGAAAGLAALFCRELAGPYCALAAVWALRARRWREVALWTAGFAVYAGYFAWHVTQVRQWRSPEAIAHDGSWLQFGGLPFVISLAQVHAFLLNLPQGFAAGYLACAVFAAAGWRTPWGRRVAGTLVMYIALFACVGYDFNQYWGVLLAPPLALCAAGFPVAFVDLCRAAQLPCRLPFARLARQVS